MRLEGFIRGCFGSTCMFGRYRGFQETMAELLENLRISIRNQLAEAMPRSTNVVTVSLASLVWQALLDMVVLQALSPKPTTQLDECMFPPSPKKSVVTKPAALRFWLPALYLMILIQRKGSRSQKWCELSRRNSTQGAQYPLIKEYS